EGLGAALDREAQGLVRRRAHLNEEVARRVELPAIDGRDVIPGTQASSLSWRSLRHAVDDHGLEGLTRDRKDAHEDRDCQNEIGNRARENNREALPDGLQLEDAPWVDALGFHLGAQALDFLAVRHRDRIGVALEFDIAAKGK